MFNHKKREKRKQSVFWNASKFFFSLFFFLFFISIISAWNFEVSQDSQSVTISIFDSSNVNDTNASTACSGTDYLAGNGSCLSVAAGSGDISGVNAGSGLIGGGLNGEVTLNVSADVCGSGNVSKYNGTHFTCVVDSGSAGGISWATATNGTLFETSLYNTNYSANDADYRTTFNSTYDSLNSSGWIINWSQVISSGSGISWATATNGTLVELTTLLNFGYYNLTDFDINDYLTIASWNTNYSANNENWLSITNTSYYLATNPDGFLTNESMNKTVSCLDIFGDDTDFCNDATGAGGKNGGGIYLYNDSSSIFLNDTILNATIDDRDANTFNTSSDIWTVVDNLTYISFSDETNLDVNSSNWWDSYDTANTTQISNVAGVLTILTSYLSTAFDSFFSGKTTDDLTEGSSNLYYDFTNASGSFVNEGDEQQIADVWVNSTGDNMTGNLEMNQNNVTNKSFSTFCNGVNCWRMYVNASDFFIIEEI